MHRKRDKVKHIFKSNRQTKLLWRVADLFGDLVYGHEVLFIQDAVSKGISKASQNGHTQIKNQHKPCTIPHSTKLEGFNFGLGE